MKILDSKLVAACFLILAMCMGLVACDRTGNALLSEDESNTNTSAVYENSEARGNKAVIERENKEIKDNADIFYGSIDDATYLVLMQINPEIIIGYDSNYAICCLASQNEDGAAILSQFEESYMIGAALEDVVRDLTITAMVDGYAADDFKVNYSFIKEPDPDENFAHVISEASNSATAETGREINYVCDGWFDVVMTPEEMGVERQEYVSNCLRCDGTGEIKCKTCNGSGIETTICDLCNGSGWLECDICGRDGSIGICHMCNGAGGQWWDGANDTKVWETCKSCLGDGQEHCYNCNNEGKGEKPGYAKCYRCEGVGSNTENCTICDGGKNICPDCEGSGVISK